VGFVISVDVHAPGRERVMRQCPCLVDQDGVVAVDDHPASDDGPHPAGKLLDVDDVIRCVEVEVSRMAHALRSGS
jgi:aspartyl/asparaginyl beta-hydroxylase (cupin superfamily)